MKFLSVKEIARILQVSPSSVYHRLQAKEVNFYRIGRSVRVKEEDFEKYLKNKKLTACSNRHF